MNFLTEPRFQPSKRPFSLDETLGLLNTSDAVMLELLVKNVVCLSASPFAGFNMKTLLHSALDILVAHLFLKLEQEERSAPHRQLLAIATVGIIEESGKSPEESSISLAEVRRTLANSDELKSLHLDHYEERLALEIHNFWPIIRHQPGGW